MTANLSMTPEVMLDLARKTAELVVQRIEGLPEENAWDGEFRQILADQLMEAPPEDGRPAAEVLEQVAQTILPFTTRLDHPRCFGFVPSSPTWPGVLADFIAAGYNVNACTWLVASGPIQVELVVIDWFRRWLGYPDNAGGLLTSGGSAASVDAFVAARENAGHPDRATVYMSNQSHSAHIRAARIVGIRPEGIRMIPVDEQYRLDMDALARAVADDRAAGFSPIAICANAGAASTGAIDPLEAMADYCAAEGIELHNRNFTIEYKWFFQPYEVGCLLVKDAATLERAFGVKHDVLQDTIWGADHPNISDRGLQLSRSFRALKVWMSVQTFGMAAFRQAISGGMELAARAEEYVRKSPHLEMLNPASLGIVCFRFNPGNTDMEAGGLEQVNRTILARIFWEDPAFISSTSLQGVFALRLCIINHNTTWDDVHETLDAVERFGVEALSEREV